MNRRWMTMNQTCGSKVMYKRDEQLTEAANLKAKQLESEIRASNATSTQKANMLHTLSKLTMFAADAWIEVKE